MRTVHVYPTYVRSLAEGITRNVHDLSTALDAAGVDVRLDAPRVDLDDLNAHTHHLTKGWEAHRRARQALEDPAVDLVHYHVGVPVTGLMAGLARARADTRTPLVLHVWNAVYDAERVHGEIGWRDRATHRLLNGPLAARLGVEGADALLVPSRFQASQLDGDGGGRPVGVIPNGVDTDRFEPASRRERERARDALGVTGDPTVLYYGHLSPWKGVDALVDALPALFDEHPGAEALIAHTAYGEGAARLRARLEALGARDRVRLAGRSDVSRLHAAADVATLPTLAPVGTACHPNVLLECMAGGLPVVASRVGSIPEVVDDGVDGLLVPPGEPGAIAEALGRLADDPALRRRLGKRARASILERFTWAHVADRVRGFYTRLADGDEVPERVEVPAGTGESP